jgi:hypothetical protein
MRNNLSLIAGAALAWTVSMTSALAQHPCWIKTVTRTSGGVAIYFNGEREVSLNRDGKMIPYLVRPINLPVSTPNAYRIIAPALQAQIGDKFFSMNSPEDVCSGEVTMQSGQVGVTITVAFHPPGLPGEESKLFIAADPTAQP